MRTTDGQRRGRALNIATQAPLRQPQQGSIIDEILDALGQHRPPKRVVI
jgi:hypothetical protein